MSFCDTNIAECPKKEVDVGVREIREWNTGQPKGEIRTEEETNPLKSKPKGMERKEKAKGYVHTC